MTKFHPAHLCIIFFVFYCYHYYHHYHQQSIHLTPPLPPLLTLSLSLSFSSLFFEKYGVWKIIMDTIKVRVTVVVMAVVVVVAVVVVAMVAVVVSSSVISCQPLIRNVTPETSDPSLPYLGWVPVVSMMTLLHIAPFLGP